MNEKYNALFTPWKIGNVEIKNRIVQCSMGGTSLFGWMEPNHFDKEAAYFLLNRAQDGVGLILPGMQCIRDPLGIPGRKWLYQNDQMFKQLKEYMVEFHKTGAKLFIQLAAGMGRSMAINGWMTKLAKNNVLNKIASPIVDVQYICASASEVPNRWKEDVMSRPLTVKEIEDMVYAFGQTAKKLRAAGVDGVEIHAVHEGYLLDQFTMANWNHRTDKYGGSFENRFRFPVEIVQEIKRQAGSDFPVSLRYSVVSRPRPGARAPCRTRPTSSSSAAICRSPRRPSSTSRTRATICSTATTAPTMPGTGHIRRSTCPITATSSMSSTSSSSRAARSSAPAAWTP